MSSQCNAGASRRIDAAAPSERRNGVLGERWESAGDAAWRPSARARARRSRDPTMSPTGDGGPARPVASPRLRPPPVTGKPF
jgi:hypothetical protein